MQLGLSLALTLPRGNAATALSVSVITYSGGMFQITVSKASTIYWLTSGSPTQMTGAAIKADVIAATPEAEGSFAVSAGTSDNSLDLTGTSTGTRYLHVAADDGSTVVAAAPFEFVYDPDVTAPTLSGVSVTPGTTTASVAWSTDEANGTGYVLIDTNATRTAGQVEAGGGAYSASQAVTATGAQTAFSATGLTASTAYYSHVMHEDAAGNQSAVTDTSFSTTGSLSYTQGLTYSDQDFNTTLNVTMPASVTTGSLLLAVIVMGDLRTISAAPSGWSSVGSFNHEGSTGTTYVYKRTSDGTEGGTTPQWTSSAACKYVAHVLNVAGSSGNVEMATSAAGLDPPPLTPTGGSLSRIWVAGAAGPGSNTYTFTAAPSGYSNMTTGTSNAAVNGSSGEATSAVATKLATASSEDPGTFTLSNAGPGDNRSAFTLAVW